MNSEHILSPGEVLDTIVGFLSEERIVSEVDEPLYQAVQAFRLKVNAPISHPGFNRVIADFIRHLYQNGLRLPRHLSRQEALTEAIFLLSSYYQGVYTEGYDGALLDATSNNLEGIELVLYRMAESVKDVERRKYLEWVFTDNIDALDWEKKERIVSAYLKQYQDFLPSRLREIDPARLVDHLRDLIMNHLSTDSLMGSFGEPTGSSH